MASTAGKIELESAGDESPEDRIVERLITKAVYATFNRRIAIEDLEPLVEAFDEGLTLETGDRIHSAEYVRWASEVPGLAEAIRRTGVLAVDGVTGSREASRLADRQPRPRSSRRRSSSCSRGSISPGG